MTGSEVPCVSPYRIGSDVRYSALERSILLIAHLELLVFFVFVARGFLELTILPPLQLEVAFNTWVVLTQVLKLYRETYQQVCYSIGIVRCWL